MYGHGVCRQKPETKQEVKEMVRHLVVDLENLQGSLNQVVGDIRALVDQIDSVTSRIDEKYGVAWRMEDSEMNIPKFNTESKENKIPVNKYIKDNSNLACRDDLPLDRLRVEDSRTFDASPDLDLSYLHITPGEQRSRWGNSLIFSESTPVSALVRSQSSTKTTASDKANSNDTETSVTSLQTCIPTARCYAQIKRDDPTEELTSPEMNASSENQELSVGSPNFDIVEPWATDTGSYIHEESPDVPITSGLTPESPEAFGKPSKRSPTIAINLQDISLNFVYGAQAMDVGSSDVSPSHNLEDLLRGVHENGGLSYDLVNSKIVNVDSSSDHNTDSSDDDVEDDYDGMYERLMERQLENLSASSECSGCSESSEYNMELESLEKSDATSFSDDIEVRYDRDINTWTSYTLAHMNSSARSSDSFLSETTSDILNDNTQATIMYGNMIFSDQLVVLNAPKCAKNRHHNPHSIRVHPE